MFSPPTDSFVKFTTVLGFLVMVYSLNSLSEAYDEVDNVTESFIAENMEFFSSAKKYIQEVNEIKQYIRDNGGFDGTSDETVKHVGVMLDSTDNIQEKANGLADKSLLSVMVYRKRVNRFESKRIILTLSVALGLGGFIWGARSWYRSSSEA